MFFLLEDWTKKCGAAFDGLDDFDALGKGAKKRSKKYGLLFGLDDFVDFDGRDHWRLKTGQECQQVNGG